MALFQKQKQEKKRKGENVIGKIIYGFLLFAPLFNILVTCMYITFNKNAYQSYSDEIIENNTLISNLNQIQEGSYLQLNYLQYDNSTNYSNYYYFDHISLDIETLLGNQYNPSINYDRIRTRQDGNLYLGTSSDSSYVNIVSNSWGVTITNFAIRVKDPICNNYTQNINQGGITMYQYNYRVDTLDNAFIFGTKKTEESNLFNWAKTTGTYTVLTNVTTGIGITNTFIPMLMAYWLLISVVYFLFDIALILIWAVHDKIHDLKDAI